MFDNFCFGVAVRPNDLESCDVCPYDKTLPPLPRSEQSSPSLGPQSSMMDLTSQLDGHSLQYDCDDLESSRYSLPSPPILHGDDSDAFFSSASFSFGRNDKVVSERKTFATKSLSASSRSGAVVKCRRAQRQMNAQLLCTAKQQRSIGSLVEEMVATGSQCNITTLSSSSLSSLSLPPKVNNCITDFLMPDQAQEDTATASASAFSSETDQVDEGFYECEDADLPPSEAMSRMLLSMRRSRGPTGALHVARGQLNHRRAGDWASLPGSVQCPPRVRRKIGRRKTQAEIVERRATA